MHGLEYGGGLGGQGPAGRARTPQVQAEASSRALEARQGLDFPPNVIRSHRSVLSKVGT